MATRTPQAAAARRLNLLRELLAGPFDNNKAELGRRLGYKDGSLIGQFLREERPLTEATESLLMALPEFRQLAGRDAAGQSLEARPVSQFLYNLTTPRSWGEVMSRGQLPVWPAELAVVMPDRSLEPNVEQGDHLTFAACDSADPTNVVVIEQEDGSRWIRRLVMRADGSLWGVSTRPDAFPDIPAAKVIAKAVRRASQFTGF